MSSTESWRSVCHRRQEYAGTACRLLNQSHLSHPAETLLRLGLYATWWQLPSPTGRCSSARGRSPFGSAPSAWFPKNDLLDHRPDTGAALPDIRVPVPAILVLSSRWSMSPSVCGYKEIRRDAPERRPPVVSSALRAWAAMVMERVCRGAWSALVVPSSPVALRSSCLSASTV